MNYISIALALMTLGCTNTLWADIHHTATGRYLSVENKPTAVQADLLSQTLQIHFPASIQTVGEALAYVLRYSGYSLVAPEKQSGDVKNTLQKPVPPINRSLGPMSLRNALLTLMGPAFTLIDDPLNREINFKVKSAYTHHAR